MKTLRVLAAAAALTMAAGPWTSPASASNAPIDPLPGAKFDTTERYDFAVEHAPGDPEWAIVLAPAGRSEALIVPADGPDTYNVDFGWVAARFNRVGKYTWSACTYDPATSEIDSATCSEPRPFLIAFRLNALGASEAMADAQLVYKKLTRFDLPDDAVKCHRQARTRLRCRVGAYIGDTVIYGHVFLSSARPPGARGFDMTRYRATLRIYDEYCHVVNKRPLSECDKPYKTRTGWE